MSQQPPWNSYDSNEQDPRRDQDQQSFAGPQSQWPTQASSWPQGQNQGDPASQSQAPAPGQPLNQSQAPNYGQATGPGHGPAQGQQPSWPSQPSPWPAAGQPPNQGQPPGQPQPSSWPSQTPSWPSAGQQPGQGQAPSAGQPSYQGQRPYPGQQQWPGQQAYQGQQPYPGQAPFQGQQPSWPQGGAGQPPFSGIGGYNYHNAGSPRYYGSGAPRRRFRVRRVRGAIFGIIAVIIAGSVLKAVLNDSSSSDVSSGSVDVTPTSTQAVSAPGATGTYFKVQDAAGDSYDIALVKVIDPAQGADQFTAPASGKRFVGLEFTIKGLSGTLQDEDANNDAFAVSAGGQKYSADFDSLAGYTNFNEGAIHVSKGQTVTGTVTFQIPTTVKVTKAEWTSASGFGSTVQWNL